VAGARAAAAAEQGCQDGGEALGGLKREGDGRRKKDQGRPDGAAKYAGFSSGSVGNGTEPATSGSADHSGQAQCARFEEAAQGGK
jgi:hypothetical protein